MSYVAILRIDERAGVASGLEQRRQTVVVNDMRASAVDFVLVTPKRTP